jgi:hypothetical protein
VLADAQGISADGRTIVGGAIDLTTGQTHGYVAVIPEPASRSVAAAIGALLLLARRGPRGR